MDRRTFIQSALAAGTVGLAGTAAFERWIEITPDVHYPGREEGHRLRNQATYPSPSYTLGFDTLIIGSGVAGLTAAWKLNKEGHKNFHVITGPEKFGNAAGGVFKHSSENGAHGHVTLPYPKGAHYLPIPAQHLVHVRELLDDLKVIRDNPYGSHPTYDERYLVHGPSERILINNEWQEGLIPQAGISDNEQAEFKRFFSAIESLRDQHGKDGKRVFTLPIQHASKDPEWLALDKITFAQWLEQQHYTSPALCWYCDYCCKDDYGQNANRISAWAGLHFFCSRVGQASNASRGEVLTWPNGLNALCLEMENKVGNRFTEATALSVKQTAQGMETLCLKSDAQVREYFLIESKRVIFAAPLFVAKHVIADIQSLGYTAKEHQPTYAPWLVSNFVLKNFPQEKSEAPLSWDNVVYGSSSLGYVVATHQNIRQTPPSHTVFTAYHALGEKTPAEARQWLNTANSKELLDIGLSDLRSTYGWTFDTHVLRAELTVRGHAMCSPTPHFLGNSGVDALRNLQGQLLFAHSDLSGLSIFEEASWWGYQAALKVLR